ncbi:MAG: hypothetical protein R3C32_08155 [Chloroflexota bacterium]
MVLIDPRLPEAEVGVALVLGTIGPGGPSPASSRSRWSISLAEQWDEPEQLVVVSPASPSLVETLRGAG